MSEKARYSTSQTARYGWQKRPGTVQARQLVIWQRGPGTVQVRQLGMVGRKGQVQYKSDSWYVGRKGQEQYLQVRQLVGLEEKVVYSTKLVGLAENAVTVQYIKG